MSQEIREHRDTESFFCKLQLPRPIQKPTALTHINEYLAAVESYVQRFRASRSRAAAAKVRLDVYLHADDISWTEDFLRHTVAPLLHKATKEEQLPLLRRLEDILEHLHLLLNENASEMTMSSYDFLVRRMISRRKAVRAACEKLVAIHCEEHTLNIIDELRALTALQERTDSEDMRRREHRAPTKNEGNSLPI